MVASKQLCSNKMQNVLKLGSHLCLHSLGIWAKELILFLLELLLNIFNMKYLSWKKKIHLKYDLYVNTVGVQGTSFHNKGCRSGDQGVTQTLAEGEVESNS